MKRTPVLLLPLIFLSVPSTPAQEDEPISKTLEDRARRGTLADRVEKIRGDSGKWRDQARLQVSGPLPEGDPKQRSSLDGWADALDLKNIRLGSGRDTWLIFRTAQLDDNDRLWIQKIERKGDRITVVLNHAVWQGYYSKNFTWYGVYGVNLGKLPVGKFQATWTVKPLVFQQFEDPKNRRTSWPKDEKAADGDVPAEKLTVSFSVSG